MQTLIHMKRPRLPAVRAHWRRWFAPSLLILTALPVYAQSTGNDPWDNAVNVLKTAFTGTIATGLSLVAIVVGVVIARRATKYDVEILRVLFNSSKFRRRYDPMKREATEIRIARRDVQG